MNRLEKTRAALIATFPAVWIQDSSDAFEIREHGIFWAPAEIDRKLLDHSTPLGDVRVGWPTLFRDRPSGGCDLTHVQLRVIANYVAARTSRAKP